MDLWLGMMSLFHFGFFTDRPILNIACFDYLFLSTCYRWNMAVLWSSNLHVAVMTALGPKGNLDASLSGFIRYSAPMLALGLAAFIMARLSKTGFSGVDKKNGPVSSNSEGQNRK